LLASWEASVVFSNHYITKLLYDTFIKMQAFTSILFWV